jgi:hypothetical protein
MKRGADFSQLATIANEGKICLCYSSTECQIIMEKEDRNVTVIKFASRIPKNSGSFFSSFCSRRWLLKARLADSKE